MVFKFVCWFVACSFRYVFLVRALDFDRKICPLLFFSLFLLFSPKDVTKLSAFFLVSLSLLHLKCVYFVHVIVVVAVVFFSCSFCSLMILFRSHCVRWFEFVCHTFSHNHRTAPFQATLFVSPRHHQNHWPKPKCARSIEMHGNLFHFCYLPLLYCAVRCLPIIVIAFHHLESLYRSLSLARAFHITWTIHCV